MKIACDLCFLTYTSEQRLFSHLFYVLNMLVIDCFLNLHRRAKIIFCFLEFAYIYGIVHFWKTTGTFCNHNILVLNISGDWLIFQIVPGTGGSKDYRLLQNILLSFFCWFFDLSTSNVFQIEII